MQQLIEDTLSEKIKRITYVANTDVKLLNGCDVALTTTNHFYDSDIETKFNILYNQEYLLKYFSKKQILKAIKDSKVTLSDLTTYSTVIQKNQSEFNYNLYKKYLPISCHKTIGYEKIKEFGNQEFQYTKYEFTCLTPSWINDIRILKELLKDKYNLTMCKSMYLQDKFTCYINMPIEYKLLNGEKENITFSINLDELINKNQECAIDNVIKRNLEYIYSYYYCEYKIDETKEILTNMVKDFFDKQK